MRIILFMLLALLPAAGARAEWHRAESRHVIVHAEGSAEEVAGHAADIESLHRLLAAVTGARERPRSYKLEIFILDDIATTRRLVAMPPAMRAFYTSGRFGDMAVVGRRDADIPHDLPTWRWALFHEYSHYFMMHHMSALQPLWFIEGFASVFETAERVSPATMRFGAHPPTRDAALRPVRLLPVEKLLTIDPDFSDEGTALQYYAEGWLLSHHYLLGAARRAELGAYLARVQAGEKLPALDTMFSGGVAGLAADVAAYRAAGKFRTQDVPIAPVDPAGIEVKPLTQGSLELMPLKIRATAISGYEGLDEIVAAALALAKKHPGEREVAEFAAWLAFAANDYESARELAAPFAAGADANARFLALQGLLVTREALDGAEAEEFGPILRRARGLVERALALAPDDPVALQAMYSVYEAQLDETPAVAYDYLARAVENAPANHSLRFTFAEVLIRKRDLERAAAILRPLANAPHPGPSQAKAQAYVAALEERIAKQR